MNQPQPQWQHPYPQQWQQPAKKPSYIFLKVVVLLLTLGGAIAGGVALIDYLSAQDHAHSHY